MQDMPFSITLKQYISLLPVETIDMLYKQFGFAFPCSGGSCETTVDEETCIQNYIKK